MASDFDPFLANQGLRILSIDSFYHAKIYGAEKIALKNFFISAEFNRK